MSSACATLGPVTDPGRSTVPDSPDRHGGGARGAALPVAGTPDPAGAPGPASRALDPAGPFLTAEEIAAVTGGTLLRRSDRRVRLGAVDSRLVVPGSLFVALAGERTDGHRFLVAAAQAGAAALLVGRHPDPAAGEAPLDALGDVTVVLVADPLRALHAVAASWRRRFDLLVVGVTGSIAKTSTKEAVAGVLACRYETLRTEGNQNNEVGMPLTVLRLGPEHGAAVLEMGMYTGGEIRDLAAIGLPSIGIVTAIQPVHLSRIGSVEAIVDAKAELLEALPSAADGGFAILNADDPRVRAMAPRTHARVVSYGFAPDADVRATDVASGGFEGMRFRLVTPAGERSVAIRALGRLAVHNALAAAAAGLAAGLDLDELLPGLDAGSTAPHRSVLIRAGRVVIVDAKAELLEALPGAADGGVAILNADDPRVRAMAPRTRARVVSYGFAPDADVRATDVASGGFEGMRFRLVTPVGERSVAIRALGRLAVHNALAAAAAGLAAGLDLDELLPGLDAGSTAPHRSVLIRAGGVVIVDDSYNAAPGSVRAALELLAGLPGRRVAVLGELRELGSAHAGGHRAVGEVAGDTLDLLVVVDGAPGGAAEGIAQGARAAGLAPDRVIAVPDAAAAVDVLRDRLAPGDVVLVKASRGVALERVVDGLVETLGGAEAPA